MDHIEVGECVWWGVGGVGGGGGEVEIGGKGVVPYQLWFPYCSKHITTLIRQRIQFRFKKYIFLLQELTISELFSKQNNSQQQRCKGLLKEELLNKLLTKYFEVLITFPFYILINFLMLVFFRYFFRKCGAIELGCSAGQGEHCI